MIVPSIDLVSGNAVQLVGGETLAIDAGDPRPLMERFSLVGEVAVIDIDAARGDGDNADLIAELCAMGPVRVGGGIRDRETALRWLAVGADKVIIGTAATRELLETLPADRVIVALDARDGEVVTHGWRTRTGTALFDAIAEVRGLCCGILVTFVEREGRLAGTDLTLAQRVVAAAGEGCRVTIAGGVTDSSEVAALDHIGADAQVGMALYNGQLPLHKAIGAILTSDREDGLWPTVVVDEAGVALGLAWSDPESLEEAIDTRTGVYHSRKRGTWRKGASSGATQTLVRVDLDCDRDAIRFTVRQSDPGFCHTAERTCWGEDAGIGRLARRLERIREQRPAGSNTVQLFDDADLLASKLVEEAHELAAATGPEAVVHEAADLIYFTVAKATAEGVPLTRIAAELDRRERLVGRRPMTAKEDR
ncbi:MAG: phosphoribosyl-ATP diphosphatase [Acidimicrobiia bacterium]